MKRIVFILLFVSFTVRADSEHYREYTGQLITNGQQFSNVQSAPDCSQAVAVTSVAESGQGRGGQPNCYNVNLTWDVYAGDVGLVSTAELLRSTFSDMSSSANVINDCDFSLGGCSDSYNADGPQPNTTYYYAVKLTFNNGCPEQWSNTNQVNVTCHAAAVFNLAVDTVTETTVDISWNLTDGLPALNKQTVRWGIATGVYTHSDDVAVDATSYSITGLTTGVPIFFVVDTNDGNGCTARSDEGTETPQ